jgi:hypothetical protein
MDPSPILRDAQHIIGPADLLMADTIIVRTSGLFPAADGFNLESCVFAVSNKEWAQMIEIYKVLAPSLIRFKRSLCDAILGAKVLDAHPSTETIAFVVGTLKDTYVLDQARQQIATLIADWAKGEGYGQFLASIRG